MAADDLVLKRLISTNVNINTPCICIIYVQTNTIAHKHIPLTSHSISLQYISCKFIVHHRHAMTLGPPSPMHAHKHTIYTQSYSQTHKPQLYHLNRLWIHTKTVQPCTLSHFFTSVDWLCLDLFLIIHLQQLHSTQ